MINTPGHVLSPGWPLCKRSGLTLIEVSQHAYSSYQASSLPFIFYHVILATWCNWLDFYWCWIKFCLSLRVWVWVWKCHSDLVLRPIWTSLQAIGGPKPGVPRQCRGWAHCTIQGIHPLPSFRPIWRFLKLRWAHKHVFFFFGLFVCFLMAYSLLILISMVLITRIYSY